VARRIHAGHELRGAPADIHDQTGARQVVDRRAGRRKAPCRLLGPREDLDRQSELIANRRKNLVPVCRVAQSARARYLYGLHLIIAGHTEVVAEGVEKAALRSVSDAAPGIDALSQPHEPIGGVQPSEPGAVPLGHEQLGGVGADVDGGETHGRAGGVEVWRYGSEDQRSSVRRLLSG
jgi:hypothetical protein